MIRSFQSEKLKVKGESISFDHYVSGFVNILAWTGFGLQFGFALMLDMLYQDMFYGTSIDLGLSERLYPLLFLIAVTGSVSTFWFLTNKNDPKWKVRTDQSIDYRIRLMIKCHHSWQRLRPLVSSFVFISILIAIPYTEVFTLGFSKLFSWVYFGFFGLLALFFIDWSIIKSAEAKLEGN